MTAAGDATLLADCVRLIEAAEARRGRFVVLADRVARRYAPAVHLVALATFAWWFFVAGAGATQALLAASAVLIVTCPCALGLAVPAVQVIATSRLFRAGVLLKSATALERLAAVDTVVFDKTGTLTEPLLGLSPGVDQGALLQAASLAANSRHPLARALVAAAGPVAPAEGVTEHPGAGLCAGDVRLGSRAFCGVAEAKIETEIATAATLASPELWLSRSGHPPVRFGFGEVVRADAALTVQRLRELGLDVHLLSGDRAASVRLVAAALGIADWLGERTPVQKVAEIEALRAAGRTVLMVGDGLNDSPSLAAATVSASPASAADVSQTVADVVFQGKKLAPVALLIATARRAQRVMRGNLVLALGYNALMVPLAVAGYVTPWLAAAAMSGSSLLVMANSFRLRAERQR